MLWQKISNPPWTRETLHVPTIRLQVTHGGQCSFPHIHMPVPPPAATHTSSLQVSRYSFSYRRPYSPNSLLISPPHGFLHADGVQKASLKRRERRYHWELQRAMHWKWNDVCSSSSFPRNSQGNCLWLSGSNFLICSGSTLY